MIQGEFKKILWQVFDVLGFLEPEREKALNGFKNKFASQLLMEFQDCLSGEQRQWIADVTVKKEYDKSDPKIQQIQQAIDSTYPKEKMDKVSKEVFKKILASYVVFMSQKLPDKAEKLNTILNQA